MAYFNPGGIGNCGSQFRSSSILLRDGGIADGGSVFIGVGVVADTSANGCAFLLGLLGMHLVDFCTCFLHNPCICPIDETHSIRMQFHEKCACPGLLC